MVERERMCDLLCFFFQAEDGIRDLYVTGVQTCALPIWCRAPGSSDRGRSIQVLGTRGCPYKCSFCSSPQMWTTKYVVRERSEERRVGKECRSRWSRCR